MKNRAVLFLKVFRVFPICIKGRAHVLTSCDARCETGSLRPQKAVQHTFSFLPGLIYC